MSNKECSIVKDLLPLYIDHVVSQDTENFVKEHLEQCESCKKEYDLLLQEITLSSNIDMQKENIKILNQIKKKIKKKKIYISIASILFTIFVFIILFTYYNKQPISTAYQETIPIELGEQITFDEIQNDGPIDSISYNIKLNPYLDDPNVYAPVDTYTVEVTRNGKIKNYIFEVKDTTSPKFKKFQKEIHLKKGQTIKSWDKYFEGEDLSLCFVKVIDDDVNYNKTGEYTIKIIAQDQYGNKNTKSSKLIISE